MGNVSTTRLAIDIGQEEPYHIEINRQDVEIRALPESLHGATFAQVSDIHGGFADLTPVYSEALTQVNDARPDYIFFTGDFVDKRATRVDFSIEDYLKSFRASRGLFACLGNHDHRRGKVGTARMLEKAGIRLLDNESVRLEGGLRLAGVDDLHEGQPDIARTFAELPADRTSIVLSHNPRLIENSGGRDILILSGHTHGAQFRLKFPPPLLICYVHLRCWQVSGWYQRGRSRLYVNRGLGVTGKPFRIDCPAEISIFRMVPHPDDHTPTPAGHQKASAAAAGRR